MRISFASCLITGVEAGEKKERVVRHDVGLVVVTRIHQVARSLRARVSNGTCGFSRPESGRWIKKSLIIVKCDENTLDISPIEYRERISARNEIQETEFRARGASSCSSNLLLFSRRIGKTGIFTNTVPRSPKHQDRGKISCDEKIISSRIIVDDKNET